MTNALVTSAVLTTCVLLFAGAVRWIVVQREKSQRSAGVYANRFVMISDDGMPRELSDSEKAHLNAEYRFGDGNRPYIKDDYRSLTPDGRIFGYLPRRKLPRDLSLPDPNSIAIRHRRILTAVQLVVAILLVSTGSTVVVLWIVLAAMSFDATKYGLLPWTAAGVLLFGLAFIAIASIASIPGIIWAKHLAESIPARWRSVATIPARTGSIIMVIGLLLAVAVLVFVSLRSR